MGFDKKNKEKYSKQRKREKKRGENKVRQVWMITVHNKLKLFVMKKDEKEEEWSSFKRKRKVETWAVFGEKFAKIKGEKNIKKRNKRWRWSWLTSSTYILTCINGSRKHDSSLFTSSPSLPSSSSSLSFHPSLTFRVVRGYPLHFTLILLVCYSLPFDFLLFCLFRMKWFFGRQP